MFFEVYEEKNYVYSMFKCNISNGFSYQILSKKCCSFVAINGEKSRLHRFIFYNNSTYKRIDGLKDDIDGTERNLFLTKCWPML